MENNRPKAELKSANALYKEYIVPYYPETSFKEFSSYFMKLYEKDKAMGYPLNELTWLNAWFAENGEKWKASGESHKNTMGDMVKEEAEKLKDKLLNEVKGKEAEGAMNSPAVIPPVKKIWGMKPVIFYTGVGVATALTIWGIVNSVKTSKK